MALFSQEHHKQMINLFIKNKVKFKIYKGNELLEVFYIKGIHDSGPEKGYVFLTKESNVITKFHYYSYRAEDLIKAYLYKKHNEGKYTFICDDLSEKINKIMQL